MHKCAIYINTEVLLQTYVFIYLGVWFAAIFFVQLYKKLGPKTFYTGRMRQNSSHMPPSIPSTTKIFTISFFFKTEGKIWLSANRYI